MPEPKFQVPGPRAAYLEPGLLILFGNQLLVLFEGVGVETGRSAALGPRFYDGLAEAVADNLVLYSALLRDWT